MTENDKSISKWGLLTGWRKIAESLPDPCEFTFPTTSSDNTNNQITSHLPEISQRNRLKSIIANQKSRFEDDFEIIEEIGSGAFGKALKSKRLCDNEIVVVKEINSNYMEEKEKSETMNEVKVLAYLNHPNIVKYHDFYAQNNKIHIVMEYCEEGDLAKYLKMRNGKLLEENEIMLKFVQICLALKHIHNKDILHRDLKTQNIFMSQKGILKLGDFGISRVLSNENSMAKSMVGTPYYLSPEICEDKPYGCKSDVWSLGCVLYELCTLKHAFDGQCLPVLIFKILSGKFPPISDSYSSNLQNLVKKILCKNPDDRPSLDEILNFSYVRIHLQRYGAHIHYCVERRRDSFLRSIEPFNLDASNNKQFLQKRNSHMPIYKMESIEEEEKPRGRKTQKFFSSNLFPIVNEETSMPTENNEDLVEIAPYRYYSQGDLLEQYPSILDGGNEAALLLDNPLIVEQTINKQKIIELKTKYFGDKFKLKETRLRLETLDEEMDLEELNEIEENGDVTYQSDNEENQPIENMTEDSSDDDFYEVITEADQDILESSPSVVVQLKEIFHDPLTKEIDVIKQLENSENKDNLEDRIKQLKLKLKDKISEELLNDVMQNLKNGNKSNIEIIGKENLKYESLIFKLCRDECVLEQLLVNE